MDSGPASWHLPPGPVLRQLKRAAGDDVTAADFAPDEADQLRLWSEAQAARAGARTGRHRHERGRLGRRRRGEQQG